MQDTNVQPIDYTQVLTSAINSWWYLLTYLFPAAVYAIPAVKRWRFILWLAPVAFIAACCGYIVYWQSIDYALKDYYRKTGYMNTADTWYVFMPIFRGIPNAVFATVLCTLVAWIVSRRNVQNPEGNFGSRVHEDTAPSLDTSHNPYAPPRR